CDLRRQAVSSTDCGLHACARGRAYAPDAHASLTQPERTQRTMTFLKRLGQIIAEGIALASGFGPILQQFQPKATPYVDAAQKDLAAVAAIVVQAEAMGAALGLSGADKLRAATGPVIQILMQS